MHSIDGDSSFVPINANARDSQPIWIGRWSADYPGRAGNQWQQAGGHQHKELRIIPAAQERATASADPQAISWSLVLATRSCLRRSKQSSKGCTARPQPILDRRFALEPAVYPNNIGSEVQSFSGFMALPEGEAMSSPISSKFINLTSLPLYFLSLNFP